MIDKRTYKGYWNLPSSDRKIAGVLEFDPQNHVELQLLGTLNDDNDIYDDSHHAKIIHGFTVEGKKLTLIDCSMAYGGTSIPGFSTITYNPMKVLIGVHVGMIEELTFNEAIAELDLLTKWIDIWPYERDNLEGKGFSFNYKYLEDIQFSLGNVNGYFTFYGSTECKREEEFTTSHKAKLKFTTSLGLPLNDLTSYVWHFKKFLTLATESNTFVKSIFLKSNILGGEDGKSAQQIELLLIQRNLGISGSDKHWSRFLFTYKDIEAVFHHVIQRWYHNKEVLDPIINAVYISYTEPFLYVENRFMDIIQALETYHRRCIQNTEALKAEHKMKIKGILEQLDEDQHSFIKEKLCFGYEPALSARLKELYSLYTTNLLARITGDTEQVQSIVRTAVKSRNYYTHYDPIAKKHALKGMDLLYMSERLKVLLITAILRQIGIQKETIETIFERRAYKYEHLINS